MNENTNIDKQKLLNAIVNATGPKINKNSLERAQKGDFSGVLSGLDEQERKKLQAALSDRNRAKEILSSKEAKSILKSFLGGKSNG